MLNRAVMVEWSRGSISQCSSHAQGQGFESRRWHLFRKLICELFDCEQTAICKSVNLDFWTEAGALFHFCGNWVYPYPNGKMKLHIDFASKRPTECI